jgi:hypothetical protein
MVPHETRDILFKTVIYIWFVQRVIKKTTGATESVRGQSLVEAASNTSTVALRVEGGDKKGNTVPGVYK